MDNFRESKDTLALIVSGGHTSLLRVTDDGGIERTLIAGRVLFRSSR